MARKHRGGSRRRRRQFVYWMVLAGAAAVSAVAVLLAYISYPLHHVAVFYGFFGPAVLSFTFAGVIMKIEDREEGIDRGWGGLGLEILLFMFGRCLSYPQPLLMLVLGFGTLILGAVAGDPARDPELQRRAALFQGDPQTTPPPEEKPDEKPFEKPKTPPPATWFAGLTAYWSFDEGKGDRANDSQRKREGVLHGGKWVTGIRGQAVELNGTSDSFAPGPWEELNFAAKAPFTIACWVKTDDANGTVVGLRGFPDGLPLLDIRVVSKQATARVREDRAVFQPNEVISPPGVRPGEWHYLALTRHPDGAIEFFQDGTSVGKRANKDSAGSITTNHRSLGVEPHTDKPDPGGVDALYLRGCVDEFCVFDRVLSAAEIAELAGRKP